MNIWIVDETDDGRIELIAPNGVSLFTVSKDTAAMVGRMLLDMAEEECDGHWVMDDAMGIEKWEANDENHLEVSPDQDRQVYRDDARGGADIDTPGAGR